MAQNEPIHVSAKASVTPPCSTPVSIHSTYLTPQCLFMSEQIGRATHLSMPPSEDKTRPTEDEEIGGGDTIGSNELKRVKELTEGKRGRKRATDRQRENGVKKARFLSRESASTRGCGKVPNDDSHLYTAKRLINGTPCCLAALWFTS